MAYQKGFQLTQEIAGPERFDKQRIRMLSGPGVLVRILFFVRIFSVACLPLPFSGRWIGGKQGSRGIIGLSAGSADDFEASFFGFHAQVADHHLIDARFHARKSFSRTAGGFYLESVQFENSLEGEQYGQIVVDEKDTTLHADLFRKRKNGANREMSVAIFISHQVAFARYPAEASTHLV